jgi:hypothetical protein
MWARLTVTGTMVVVVLLGSALVACRSERISDLDGRAQDPLAGATPALLIFTSIDCPLSDRYAPELGRLYARFASRGVAWHLVYVDRTASTEDLRKHAREHLYPFEALHDPRHLLAHRSGATVTPEAALFVERRLVYRGRIDDRLVDFGKERPVPTRRDLADALEAVLAGRPVASPETAALGCPID